MGLPSADVAITTPRLDLRFWTHDDVSAMFDIYRRWEVARWLGATPKVAESEQAMHGTVDRWAALARDPFGIWAVVPHDLGFPVGTCLLVPLQDAHGEPVPEVEVGWHLHPDHWGKGYATEAAGALITRAWAAGLDQVYAVVYPGNQPSVAVTRRLGMTAVGSTNRWYGTELEAFRIDRYQGP